VASCFGAHLFICRRHPEQCYTKFNPCQKCGVEHRRREKANRAKAVDAKALEEVRKEEQREESRRKMGRKVKWTDSQKAGRLASMQAESS
jgi:hypothetical protein